MNNKIKLFETVLGISEKGAASLTSSERSLIELETRDLLSAASRKQAMKAPEGFDAFLNELQTAENADEAYSMILKFIKTDEGEGMGKPDMPPTPPMPGGGLDKGPEDLHEKKEDKGFGKLEEGVEELSGPEDKPDGPPKGLDKKEDKPDGPPKGLDKKEDKPDGPPKDKGEDMKDKKEDKKPGKDLDKDKKDLMAKIKRAEEDKEKDKEDKKDKKEDKEDKEDKEASILIPGNPASASKVKIRVTSSKNILAMFAGKPLFHAVPTKSVKADSNALKRLANKVYGWLVYEGIESAARKCGAKLFAGVDSDIEVAFDKEISQADEGIIESGDDVLKDSLDSPEDDVQNEALGDTQETRDKVNARRKRMKALRCKAQQSGKFLGNTGDVNWLLHGGTLVIQDGERLEAVHVEPGEGDDEYDPSFKWEVFSYTLDKFVIQDGELVDRNGNGDWFTDQEDLEDVASTMGVDVQELMQSFVSDNPLELASAYDDLGSYYGFNNLDGYPEMLDRSEMKSRFEKVTGEEIDLPVLDEEEDFGMEASRKRVKSRRVRRARKRKAGVEDEATFVTKETYDSKPSEVTNEEDNVIADGLDSPENDSRDEADVDYKNVEANYRKLYASRAQKMAKEANKAFVERFIRSVKIASKRMELNYDDHPYKAAALDVLSEAGLDDDVAQELTEEISDEGHSQFVAQLLERTASLMKKSDEYLEDLESDLDEMKPKPVEVPKASSRRSKKSENLRKAASAGNFALSNVGTPVTRSTQSTSKVGGIRAAVGDTPISRLASAMAGQ